MRRFAQVAAWAGLAALQYGVAVAYLSRGTWWHYLLHQFVGWGAGLALAALIAAHTRYRVPAVVALVAGQLFSIVPDLQFRYGRMPHMASMDVYLGHISIHTGPSPTLVALGSLLLGGWAFVAAAYARRLPATAIAVGAAALVTVACLLAAPVPTSLEEYSTDTAPASG
ncbi:MAG: hypothetical protein ACLGIG_01980 [Actinomycetes bacterium]